jgi:hypothetical protein
LSMGAQPARISSASIIAELLEEREQLMAHALADRQVWREIELLDLTQEGIEAEWTVGTTPLVIPRQIDLTASATS